MIIIMYFRHFTKNTHLEMRKLRWKDRTTIEYIRGAIGVENISCKVIEGQFKYTALTVVTSKLKSGVSYRAIVPAGKRLTALMSVSISSAPHAAPLLLAPPPSLRAAPPRCVNSRCFCFSRSDSSFKTRTCVTDK